MQDDRKCVFLRRDWSVEGELGADVFDRVPGLELALIEVYRTARRVQCGAFEVSPVVGHRRELAGYRIAPAEAAEPR
jgi:hypothetical protein